MKSKPGLAILIADKAHKSMSMGADDDAGDDSGEGALEAMKAFLAAVKADDPEAALEEFQNLMECAS